MENNNVDYIVDGLRKAWDQELKERKAIVRENALKDIEFDEHYITIKALKEQYPDLPLQMWVEGAAALEDEYTKEGLKDIPMWVGYEDTIIAKGKVATMVENGEITRYSFEELVDLLRPV